MLRKTLDPYEIANNSFSVLSVSSDSLRSLLQSCLRQSISLWSVVVKSAEFGFIEAVESGGEVIASRHKQAVARIVPVLRRQGSRIGTLAGRKYRMGEDFGNSLKNSCIADDFGVPRV